MVPDVHGKILQSADRLQPLVLSIPLEYEERSLATSDVLELVEQAKKVRPVDVRMVWTRHRPHTKLAKELTALATQELGLPILKTVLALRVAYPEALGSGLTVAEMPDANAKAELRELVAEIRKIVR